MTWQDCTKSLMTLLMQVGKTPGKLAMPQPCMSRSLQSAIARARGRALRICRCANITSPIPFDLPADAHPAAVRYSYHGQKAESGLDVAPTDGIRPCMETLANDLSGNPCGMTA